tara:strand:+ start:4545 stop:4985 length:441 start_codon:yes stop_codon:yes gene_type:complete
MKAFITTFTISISILSFLFLGSCSEQQPSEPSVARVNAIAIHDDSGRLAKEFHVRLASQFAVTENTDSLFNKLAELDARYVVWSKTLVKLPGTACNHEEGEHHHHDHAAEAKLEELSDEELLELQEAIQAELMMIINDFDVLVSPK